MRLLADVHVKAAYVTALRGDGHRVDRVVDADPLDTTATDADIVSFARERDTVVLTNDTKDFAGFDNHPGVIIVPQTGLTPGELAAAVGHIERTVSDTSNLVLHATGWV